MTTGVDSAGQWTPHQFVIDAGWDYGCVEDTARLGLSDTDAEILTPEQQDALFAWCQDRVKLDAS